QAPQDTSFRLGGMVVDGSVSRADDDLTVVFELTDTAEKVSVNYKGILPDLFREGQGIVTQGKLDESGTFIASEVLAKHDENYMPPEVSDAVNKAMKNNMAQ
ncbi:MAG: cytochrome c maturation protein CcmE, partial [Arenicellales bacterium WSBS_2016_MAG_OTU3]